MLGELAGELGDDHYEDEVEEELEEGDPTVGGTVLESGRGLPETPEDRLSRHGTTPPPRFDESCFSMTRCGITARAVRRLTPSVIDVFTVIETVEMGEDDIGDLPETGQLPLG
jgi:hypothetical protein